MNGVKFNFNHFTKSDLDYYKRRLNTGFYSSAIEGNTMVLKPIDKRHAIVNIPLETWGGK